jgi:hypothetical protein
MPDHQERGPDDASAFGEAIDQAISSEPPRVKWRRRARDTREVLPELIQLVFELWPK